MPYTTVPRRHTYPINFPRTFVRRMTLLSLDRLEPGGQHLQFPAWPHGARTVRSNSRNIRQVSRILKRMEMSRNR